jgi:hypothetical protein
MERNANGTKCNVVDDKCTNLFVHDTKIVLTLLHSISFSRVSQINFFNLKKNCYQMFNTIPFLWFLFLKFCDVAKVVVIFPLEDIVKFGYIGNKKVKNI